MMAKSKIQRIEKTAQSKTSHVPPNEGDSEQRAS